MKGLSAQGTRRTPRINLSWVGAFLCVLGVLCVEKPQSQIRGVTAAVTPIVEALLRRNANPHAVDAEDRTPLARAAARNHSAVIDLITVGAERLNPPSAAES